jgi:hypothetical protein
MTLAHSGEVRSGISSGSTQVFPVFSLFPFIGFPHAHDPR